MIFGLGRFSHVFFLRQFGRKLDQIRWKTRHFLSKCHGNSMKIKPNQTKLDLVKNPCHVPAWTTNKA